MMPPTSEAPEPTPEGPTTTDIKNLTPTRTENASGFGLLMDRPLTTTRRCEGWGCWCHVGAEIVWPLSHDQEMQRMARAIRTIEIAQGVLAL